MCNNNFSEGLEVYYKGYFGEHSKDVCLLVYPQDYSSIELAKASTK